MMTNLITVKVLLLWFGFTRFITASPISFAATPSSVRKVIDPLILNCTFQNTNTQLNTSDHMPAEIVDFYMYISKGDGTLLASVARNLPAEAIHDPHFMLVEGQMNYDNISYLQITWPSTLFDKPIDNSYFCSVHVLIRSGYELTFQTNVTVSFLTPSYEDLIVYLYRQRRELEHKSRSINDLKKTLSNTSHDLASLKQGVMNCTSRLHQLSLELSSTTAATGTLNQDVAMINQTMYRVIFEANGTATYLHSLQSDVKELKLFHNELTTHVEQGVRVYCGGSNTFVSSGYEREMHLVVPIVFQKPFPKVPVVTFSLRILDVPKDEHLRVFAYTQNINSTGFEMVCGTWDGSFINAMDVDWTATVV